MKKFYKNSSKATSFFPCLLLFVFVQMLPLSGSFVAHAKNSDIDSIIREAENRRIKITKTMEESTVFIFYADSDGDVSLGTGFVVGDGYILTNGHVVEGGSSFYVTGKSFTPVKAKLIKMIDNNVDDFAVLQFTPPVKLPILSFNLNLNRSDRVNAWGFPYAYTQFDKNTDALLSGDSDVVPPVITTEGVVNAFITTDTKMNSILHSANIAKGNSGGPLVNSRGHVVGVNTWISAEEGEGSHVNAALTARAAIAFLRSAGVEPRIEGGEDVPSQHSQQLAENKRKGPYATKSFDLSDDDSDSDSGSAPGSDGLTGDAKDIYPMAVEGNAEAQAYLGLAYWEGDSAPKDMQKSLYWFRKAVQNDDNNAKALLAFIYLTEVDFLNVEEGMKLLEQAAEKDAEYASGFALFSFRGEMLGIERNVEKAVRAAKRGTEVGDTEAMGLLALLYCTGDGVEADTKYAFELAEKAAKDDVGLAYAVLSWIHHDGDVGEADYEKAVSYAKKAIEEDESLGSALLGMYYHDGHGVEQDYDKAFKYASEAAEAFEETGQYLLGLLYANGEGVKSNNVKAWAYFDMAARKDVSNAAENRDSVAEDMSEKEIKDAKALVKQWHSQYGLKYVENY